MAPAMVFAPNSTISGAFSSRQDLKSLVNLRSVASQSIGTMKVSKRNEKRVRKFTVYAEADPEKKTGAQLREEYFLAAATGKERGLPEGAFLNDNVTSGPMVEITWEPYGDVSIAPEGSSLLKAAVDAGAMKIDNRFCLTGQCDVCIVEVEGGEVMRSCMKPVPSGKSSISCLVLDTDDAWEEMMV